MWMSFRPNWSYMYIVTARNATRSIINMLNDKDDAKISIQHDGSFVY